MFEVVVMNVDIGCFSGAAPIAVKGHRFRGYRGRFRVDANQRQADPAVSRTRSSSYIVGSPNVEPVVYT